MLADEDVLALAPPISYRPRQERYLGDAVTVGLEDIPPADLARLRTLYEFLSDLFFQLNNAFTRNRMDIAATGDYLQRVGYRRIFAGINELGGELTLDEASPTLRKVYHDVRAGSLSALIMHADALVAGEGEEADMERLYLLSRDHLKIMRNGIPELDPDGYRQDLEERQHGIDLFRQKWDGAEYRLADQSRSVRVEFHCRVQGSISECCMEFAALDRVIYNLVNNAARHTEDGVTSLSIVPLDNAADTNLRFAVSNRISDEQRRRLEERFGDHLERIFHGGFTTGGHGLGLRICGDVVTHGYDLFTLDEALEGGYLGVRLLDDRFVVWFHWPGHLQQ
jgi:signal transduction histidine kinase